MSRCRGEAFEKYKRRESGERTDHKRRDIIKYIRQDGKSESIKDNNMNIIRVEKS